jgi:hypothetical protein
MQTQLNNRQFLTSQFSVSDSASQDLRTNFGESGGHDASMHSAARLRKRSMCNAPVRRDMVVRRQTNLSRFQPRARQ